MYLIRNRHSYNALLESLTDGRVCITACDTIYGFVGRYPDTEEKIRSIKGRDQNQPFLVLISEVSELLDLGIDNLEYPALSLWPGPYTFIFSTKFSSTVACRIPEDYRLRSLISEVGQPLYSTSVNRTGQLAMNNPQEIDAEFGNEVALVEDSGIRLGKLPSTIIDLTCNPYRILRQGSGIVPPQYLQERHA